MADASGDYSALMAQMNENLAAIQATIASLSTTEHDAKLDELEQKRDDLLSALKAELETELHERAEQRIKEEEEIAEQRRREDEEREARRKQEDEDFQNQADEADAERVGKFDDESKRVEEETDEGIDGIEALIKKMLEEGRAKLLELEETRKEINQLIDEQMSIPLPTLKPRKRARDRAAEGDADASSPEPAAADPEPQPEPESAPVDEEEDGPSTETALVTTGSSALQAAEADDKSADEPGSEEPAAEAQSGEDYDRAKFEADADSGVDVAGPVATIPSKNEVSLPDSAPPAGDDDGNGFKANKDAPAPASSPEEAVREGGSFANEQNTPPTTKEETPVSVQDQDQDSTALVLRNTKQQEQERGNNAPNTARGADALNAESGAVVLASSSGDQSSSSEPGQQQQQRSIPDPTPGMESNGEQEYEIEVEEKDDDHPEPRGRGFSRDGTPTRESAQYPDHDSSFVVEEMEDSVLESVDGEPSYARELSPEAVQQEKPAEPAADVEHSEAPAQEPAVAADVEPEAIQEEAKSSNADQQPSEPEEAPASAEPSPEDTKGDDESKVELQSEDITAPEVTEEATKDAEPSEQQPEAQPQSEDTTSPAEDASQEVKDEPVATSQDQGTPAQEPADEAKGVPAAEPQEPEVVEPEAATQESPETSTEAIEAKDEPDAPAQEAKEAPTTEESASPAAPVSDEKDMPSEQQQEDLAAQPETTPQADEIDPGPDIPIPSVERPDNPTVEVATSGHEGSVASDDAFSVVSSPDSESFLGERRDGVSDGEASPVHENHRGKVEASPSLEKIETETEPLPSSGGDVEGERPASPAPVVVDDEVAELVAESLAEPLAEPLAEEVSSENVVLAEPADLDVPEEKASQEQVVEEPTAAVEPEIETESNKPELELESELQPELEALPQEVPATQVDETLPIAEEAPVPKAVKAVEAVETVEVEDVQAAAPEVEVGHERSASPDQSFADETMESDLAFRPHSPSQDTGITGAFLDDDEDDAISEISSRSFRDYGSFRAANAGSDADDRSMHSFRAHDETAVEDAFRGQMDEPEPIDTEQAGPQHLAADDAELASTIDREPSVPLEAEESESELESEYRSAPRRSSLYDDVRSTLYPSDLDDSDVEDMRDELEMDAADMGLSQAGQTHDDDAEISALSEDVEEEEEEEERVSHTPEDLEPLEDWSLQCASPTTERSDISAGWDDFLAWAALAEESNTEKAEKEAENAAIFESNYYETASTDGVSVDAEEETKTETGMTGTALSDILEEEAPSEVSQQGERRVSAEPAPLRLDLSRTEDFRGSAVESGLCTPPTYNFPSEISAPETVVTSMNGHEQLFDTDEEDEISDYSSLQEGEVENAFRRSTSCGKEQFDGYVKEQTIRMVGGEDGDYRRGDDATPRATPQAPPHLSPMASFDSADLLPAASSPTTPKSPLRRGIQFSRHNPNRQPSPQGVESMDPAFYSSLEPPPVPSHVRNSMGPYSLRSPGTLSSAPVSPNHSLLSLAQQDMVGDSWPRRARHVSSLADNHSPVEEHDPFKADSPRKRMREPAHPTTPTHGLSHAQRGTLANQSPGTLFQKMRNIFENNSGSTTPTSPAGSPTKGSARPIREDDGPFVSPGIQRRSRFLNETGSEPTRGHGYGHARRFDWN